MHFNPSIGNTIIAPMIQFLWKRYLNMSKVGLNVLLFRYFQDQGKIVLTFKLPGKPSTNFKQSVIKGSCKKTKKNELLVK